jgi:hypothetical protein
MQTLTAQATAAIQYPAQICIPFFGEKRGYERPPSPSVVELSDNRPETLILAPSFVSPRWSAVPPPCLPDEILDWDFFAGSEPERPSGTISVTLEYVGRGSPTDVEDIWD